MINLEARQALISLRIQQAEKTITEVEICIAQNLLGLAANRIYYGMFYAMLALGLMRQFKTSKHLQMHGWFNKNFVHTGILPNHFGQLVKKAFESRSNADYEINQIPTIADIEVLFADMKLFISTIKAWLEANPA